MMLEDDKSGILSMNIHAAKVRPMGGGNDLSPVLFIPTGPVVPLPMTSFETTPTLPKVNKTGSNEEQVSA